MTLEAYINGALSFRISNWTPTEEGQSTSDGRLVSGEWLELFAYAEIFRREQSGWGCSYRIKAVIPSRLRLDKTHTSFEFAENPGDIPQPADPWYHYKGSFSGIGPTTVERLGLRTALLHDEQHYQGNLDESWRIVVKVYFSRITHTILRDESRGIILRASDSYGGKVMCDA